MTKKQRSWPGVMQLVFLVWIITMQIVGGGAILFVIFGGDVSFAQGMTLTAIVFTLYNVTGGFAATAYTNLIHICAIIIGIFMGGLYVILNSGALAQVASQGHYFQPFGDLGPSQALSWAFINLTLGSARPTRHQHGIIGKEHPRGQKRNPYRQFYRHPGCHHGRIMRNSRKGLLPSCAIPWGIACASAYPTSVYRGLLPHQYVGAPDELRLALSHGCHYPRRERVYRPAVPYRR